MRLEPLGHGVGLAVGQHIDRFVVGHVEQDRRVGLAAFDRPIVHAQHRDLADFGIAQRPEQPQQRVLANRHPQSPSQPRARAPGQRDADRLEHAAGQGRAAGARDRDPVRLLCERAHRALVGVAEETPHPQSERHGPTADRGVGQPPVIAAVHPVGGVAARWACGLRGLGARPHQHRPIRRLLDPLDHHRGQMRKERIKIMIIALGA
jgi:hypothetical protein